MARSGKHRRKKPDAAGPRAESTAPARAAATSECSEESVGWPRRFDRPVIFWTITILLLAVMGGLLAQTAMLETATFDEPIYLTAGYSYYKLGNYWLNYEHPPFSKLLAALPLLSLDPRLPTEYPGWGEAAPTGFQFLNRNRVPPDTLLLRARAPFILMTLGFGLIIAAWTRRHFGGLAGLLALLFFALDPNMLSHGKYAANDMITAVFFFLSVIAWGRFLRSGRWRDAVLAGVVLGLALATKFSALILPALLALLYMVRWRQDPRQYSWRAFLLSSVLLGATALAVLALVYLPGEFGAQPPGTDIMLADAVDPWDASGRLFQWMGETFDLHVHPLLMGLYFQFRHNEYGHPAYLLGELSPRGWWYYFPVAFAVKTPLATLLALAGSLFFAIRTRIRGEAGRLREAPLEWVLLLIPPLVFFALAMRANINIGLRYILPVYPFLFVGLGASLAGIRKSRILLPVIAVLVVECAVSNPNYLAFFNQAAGGGRNGPRILLDSNIDWGQDLKKLKSFVDHERIDRLCLSYFGTADPAYYDLDGPWVPGTDDLGAGGPPNCVAAVSVNYLYGLAIKPRTYEWLRGREPMKRVGGSIYAFDLRKPAQRVNEKK